jgi:hypothetical protein
VVAAVAVSRTAAQSTTSGSVWLRVHATDSDGNTVEQAIQNAYLLR